MCDILGNKKKNEKLKNQRVEVWAFNGGKFDFLFVLK
jgi:hypothetical protein